MMQKTLRLVTLLAFVTYAVTGQDEAGSQCKCPAASECIKGKIREAVSNIRYMTLSDIPDECTKQTEAPAELADLQDKVQGCVNSIVPQGVPDDVEAEITDKVETCVKPALKRGCENPSLPAKLLGRLLKDSLDQVPIPGCDDELNNKLVAARLQTLDKCDLKEKLELMQMEVERKYPALVSTIKCIRDKQCIKTRKQLGNVKQECVLDHGCTAENLLGAVMEARGCSQDDPPAKMRSRFIAICECVSDKLGFDAATKSKLCTFAEGCEKVQFSTGS